MVDIRKQRNGMTRDNQRLEIINNATYSREYCIANLKECFHDQKHDLIDNAIIPHLEGFLLTFKILPDEEIVEEIVEIKGELKNILAKEHDEKIFKEACDYINKRFFIWLSRK